MQNKPGPEIIRKAADFFKICDGIQRGILQALDTEKKTLQVNDIPADLIPEVIKFLHRIGHSCREKDGVLFVDVF